MKLITIQLRGNYFKKYVYLNGKKLAIKKSLERSKMSSEFNWGYPGSGAAQLALAICLEIYGKDARFDFMKFKFDYIATLPQSNFNKMIKVPGSEALEKLLDLEKKKRNARQMENVQRTKVFAGYDVRVRPEFWEQVQRDYAVEIKNARKAYEAELNNN